MKQVLVIEDEAPIRANLVRFLRLEGYTVSEAHDGEEGVRLATELRPNLIICDYMMPKKDGFEVLEALKQNPDTQHIPFYFLSASAEPERLEVAIGKGANGYLTKPFSLDQLRTMLANHF
ncbi:response regulator [Curvibacter sp. APW13]|uniref:response regulator n=1 Tax=Curvibacter sp. APW13 TaxID=3077236 RepID=UPI0028E075DB|nr:response regulator [Curvibacter sp. APW13]MDT8991530.1 response regulator [Curvibacter sp. APW13]